MYTLPLSDQEYRSLAELKHHLKYGDNQSVWDGAPAEVTLFPDIDDDRTAYRAAAGWVLLDEHGQARGWHWIDHADPRWADQASATEAFMPETRRRRWLQLLGYRVEHDEAGRHLFALLQAAAAAPNPTV